MAIKQTDLADQPGMGREALNPAQIPWAGWRRVVRRTASSMISDRISLSAAGCAFYATLALFPGISMLVSLYGLVFDPETVAPQLSILRGLLPPTAYNLINDRIQTLVSHNPGSLSLSLLIGTLVALWSATSGTKSVLAALNIAYYEVEKRSVLRYQLTAFGMTVAALIGATLAIALLVALPAALAFLHVRSHQAALISIASYGILLAMILFSLTFVYRFGPSRQSARWHWVTPGSLVATLLWLGASALFSFYVSNIGTYDATYGPLGAVVGMMVWFYVTAYAVLLGAELNAELELQTARDSTDGPKRPLGERGAYVADHVAE